MQLFKQEHANAQAHLKQQCIRAGLKLSETAAADHAIANFFYGNGIPFSVASKGSDSLYRKMILAIKAAPAGYIPPNANKLSGPLLDECYDKVWKDLEDRDPEGLLKEKYGATYVADGWESCDSLPLINSAFISANDGGMYWRSVDTSGQMKTAEYCALLMIQDIYAYGPAYVVLVITDTCNTMAKAWAIVQDEFPWISVLCCQPHVISLLMKDIGKEKEVQQVINEEATVVGWFSNHQYPLAKLREMTIQKLGKARELIKAGATRFGTHTIVGQRLLDLKAALQPTVVDPAYVAMKYKDKQDTEEQRGDGRPAVRTNQGATTRSLVIDDDGFWERVTAHVQVTNPLYKMLRRFDTSAPAIGKVYSSWFEVGQRLKESDSPLAAKFVEKHEDRWAYGHSDILAAAYVLDPEFIDHAQCSNEEVTQGFHATIEKIAILLEVRKEDYTEAWKKRATFLGDDPSKLTSWEQFPSYPTTTDRKVNDFCKNVNRQLTLYRTKKGVFARDWVLQSAQDDPAYLWWDANGASTPELQTVARLVLAQPASASICERINSEFAFVKDVRRNRLEHSRADKLVALFHNLRLRNRMLQPRYSEPAVGWNDDDDKSGITTYGVAHYEGAKSKCPKNRMIS